jgi:hypothetical protein
MAAALAFTPHREPLEMAAITSAIALVGCIAAGLIILVLRLRARN